MYKLTIFFSLVLCLGISKVQAQFLLDVESGAVFNTKYNQVRIPGNMGTTFDLTKDLQTNPTWFYRIRAGYTVAGKHTISLLFAPLTLMYSGDFNNAVNYYGTSFNAGVPVRAQYVFNSYRLTYRFDFIRNENFRLGAGLTGKIRYAAIELSSEGTSTQKTDFGFVPLINFYLSWHFTDRLQLILEGDALVSTQGRAEDVFAGIGYTLLQDRITLKAGYRVLEGGANNDEVYNFSWLDYASAGLILRL